MNPSPLPWHVKKHPMGPEIYDAADRLVVSFDNGPNAEANAALIVVATSAGQQHIPRPKERLLMRPPVKAAAKFCAYLLAIIALFWQIADEWMNALFSYLFAIFFAITALWD